MTLSPAEGHQGHVDLTKDILYPDFLWALLSNSGSGSGPGSGFSGPWLKSSGLVSSGPGFCPASPGTRSGPWSLATGEGFSVDWTSSVWAGRSGGLCGWWRNRGIKEGVSDLWWLRPHGQVCHNDSADRNDTPATPEVIDTEGPLVEGMNWVSAECLVSGSG